MDFSALSDVLSSLEADNLVVEARREIEAPPPFRALEVAFNRNVTDQDEAMLRHQIEQLEGEADRGSVSWVVQGNVMQIYVRLGDQ